MVMRSPREELEDLVEGMQAQINSIKDDIDRMLPEGLRPPIGITKFSTPESLKKFSTPEIQMKTYSMMARNKLEELRRGVDQLRIRALRSLPKI